MQLQAGIQTLFISTYILAKQFTKFRLMCSTNWWNPAFWSESGLV